MAGKPPAAPKRPAKPKRPANLPYGRWLGDFKRLSDLERQLVEHCALGTYLTLGSERPEKPLTGNKIRADLIRFLLLGGDELNPVHEKGVMVEGAWIEDVLDLRHALCRVGLHAVACRFDKGIIAFETTIPALRLGGSSVPGLQADGIKIQGDLSLSKNFTATGEVRMLGGMIEGNLDCAGGNFANEKGYALYADMLQVKGSVFLRGLFSAIGEVRMLGAKIGVDFTCSGGTFSSKNGHALIVDTITVGGNVFLSDGFTATGQVSMLGAKIGSSLICMGGTFTTEKGKALNLDRVNIRHALFFRSGVFRGEVDLTTAFAGTLVDDQACYTNATLLLDGFRYDRIAGPTSAVVRIGWLKRQRPAYLGANFMPQPWEQLIRVLRDMGHPAEATQIAMAKQKALREARQIGLRQPNPTFSGARLGLDKGWTLFSNFLARGLHWFYGWIAGYGHRPTRIVWRMALVCALCSLAYYGGRESGLIGPSAPVLQMHPDLRRCGTGGDAGAFHWTSPACPMPPEYSTFQPFFYSLDVLIPFVDLHQETEWGPIVTNAQGETLWWGRALRWLLWFEIIFGWIASVMFVAIVGRLVDKD